MRIFLCFFFLLYAWLLSGQHSGTDLTDKIASLEKQVCRLPSLRQDSCTDGYDVIYHRCVWQADPAIRFIRGSVFTLYRSLQPMLDTLCFNLSDSLVVDSVRYHKSAVPFQHSDDLLKIILPAPPGINTIDSVTVFYSGVPPSTGFGSFNTELHDGIPVMWTLSQPYGASDWWPCKNSLTDKADSVDVHVVTPAGYRTAGNGVLVSEIIAGNDIVTIWKHRYPVATYLIAIAISNYARYEHEVITGNGPVSVLQYVYPEDSAAAAQRTPGIIPVMILFDSLFGEYPFSSEKYGQCQINWGGGMEHQTFTFMGSFDHELMSHELAHSWFGNKITCGSWEDIWLNEGFASYLTGLTYEHMFDGYWWMPFKRNRLAKIVSQPGGSVWCDDTTSVDRIFDSRLSYAKGAMILHQLRWIIGDSCFFTALRNYLADPLLAFGFARTTDLIGHLESVYAADLSWYFIDWYRGEGFPSYQITWHMSEDTLVLKVGQTQSHPSVGFFALPLPFRFKDQDHDTLVRLNHTFSGETFAIPLNFTPDSVLFDPELWLISSGNTVASIREQASGRVFSLYPNPVKDHVVITCAPQTEKLSLTLHDITGRLIREFRVEGCGPFRISLQGCSPGLYLLRIGDGLSKESFRLVIR